ncbi:MAG: elongation factor Ts [Clostridiales bacterium]|nr:elongation factor Ts [Clostridiales bacterium]
MVTAAQVKELREKTGAGMMECKKVLTETDGDLDRAMDLLKERGILKAAKKSDRIAAEGLVASYVSDDKKIGAVVEVNAETDFVGKNQEFKDFVTAVVKQVALNNPANVEDLLNEKFISNEEKTVAETLTDLIAKIGENMSLRRFERYETKGHIGTYVHGDGQIAILVDMEGGDDVLAKDISMQVAAANPRYLDESNIPADELEHEKEILKAQVINEGRPENVAGKIVEGRLGKFFSENCLVDQEFVKNPDQKIKDILKAGNAKVNRFVRFEKGEGIEKKEENFAEEVAKQLR